MSAKANEVILAGEQVAGPVHSMQDLQRMATAVAKSGIFGVKDADQALALMMIAQAEGRHPALVARDYDIIQNRPAKKSEAMLRDFIASGGRVEWHALTDELADATFHHPAAVKPVRLAWDIARAKKAGLLEKTGGMYAKYTRQMLRARCISEGCRTVAPLSTSGFYTPEEVHAMDPAPGEQPATTTAVAAASAEDAEAQVKTIEGATTLVVLESAFAAAWRSTKDAPYRLKFKAAYDATKQLIAEASAREAGEGK